MNQLLSHHQSQKNISTIITVKINHPKLVHLSLPFQTQQQVNQLLQHLNEHSMLAMFSNYHLELAGVPIGPKKTFGSLVEDKMAHVQFDIAFQHYNYATAMFHFQSVSKMLKEPIKLALLIRTDQIYIQNAMVEPEGLSRELLPSGFKITNISIQEIIAPFYKNQLWDNTVRQIPQFLQFLGMSGFHPPVQAQLSGDLFYIHAKTLQNTDLHITASPLGFYINQSKINHYNPSPVPGRPTFTSLIDLFCHCSQRFSITYSNISSFSQQSLLDQLTQRQDTIILSSQQNNNPWLDNADFQVQWNSRKESLFRENFKGVTLQADWNQMFLQIQKKSEQLRVDNDIQGLKWEHRALRKAYHKFEEAAIEGARKIALGKIQAMNNSDQKKKQIYVYNQIFFSITQQTPLNHSLDKGDELIPTGSSSNTDLIQLSELIQNRPNQIHLLHTVLIFYRGYRIIAQTILPGLLSAQLHNLTQYGSVDDNKSIHNNQDFHKLIVPICHRFHLDQQIDALDKDQKIIEVAISPQIKGIKSSNGQKYFCDLQRLSPRDFNYEGPQHQGCVLRQQLLKQFMQEKGRQCILPINPNIGTSIKFGRQEKTEKQEKDLRLISSYLREQVLKRLATTLKSKTGGDHLTDSQGLSGVFHSHGVNMRYMGEVYLLQELKESIQVKICLSRGILVRSLKHLFREALKQVSSLHLASTLAHMLNCIFSRKAHILALSEHSEVEDRTDSPEPKRKKKRKQKQQQMKNLMKQDNKILKTQPSRFQNILPQDLWQEVKQIANSRFNHSFEANIFEFHQKGLFRLGYQKYAVLRDLCLSIGIVLEKKNYPLRQSDSQEGLPFSSKSIVGFNYKVKTPTPLPLPQIKKLVTIGNKYFAQNQFAQAMKIYEQACYLMHQRGQGSELSHCLGQISRIHFMLGSIRQAFNVEAGNLAFICKTYREDSFQAVRCYSRLGLYCMNLGISQLALWLLGRGLHLMLMCFGEAYPDVLINFANIARVYLLKRQTAQASHCYIRALQLINQIYGHKTHINASFCFSSLASIYYETGEYKKSVEYQIEAVNILNKTLSSDDPRNIDAQKILKVYCEIKKSHQGRSHDPKQRRK